ncbi:macrophage mannose receptor 1-like isoform X2 [Mytilus californianus]|uniref:macrophage mannose receptor 1-like isoform X2 n=1 Tax=Mytilus californianus TaxID=6549 RepID=UPI00224665EB|nr:macrophage mannose receptor 1-like isoform X2 [Mytilus californianus]
MLTRNLLGIVLLYCLCHVCVIADPRCPLHWIKIGTHCYRTRYNYAIKTWEDGRRWCQTQDADLAKFDSVEQQDEVKNYDGLLAMGVSFWVGLHLVGEDWKWADNSTVDSLVRMRANKILIGGYNCIKLDNRNGMLVAKCHTKRGVLCQRRAGKQIRCNSAEDWQSYGNKCYKVTGHEQKGSWKQAKLFCNTKNATVASPMSSSEQYALFDFVQNNGQKLWIGVHSSDDRFNNQWIWTNGSVLDEGFWEETSSATLESKQQNLCAYINPGSTNWTRSWKAASCDTRNGNIICEMKAEQLYGNLEYHAEKRTWYDAEAVCSANRGLLATRNETFPYDSNAWIAGIIKNNSFTTAAPTTVPTTKRRTDSDELDDYVIGSYDLCPFVSTTGYSFGDCKVTRSFVCNISIIAAPLSNSPTSPAVVAVSILLVIIAILVVLFLVLWLRRKKRKDDKEIEVSCPTIEKTNGALPHDYSKENGSKTDSTENTYNHTTSSKPVTNNSSNQNLYDHCTNVPEDTYDHTETTNNGSGKQAADYGCVDLDDDQYKSIDRTTGSQNGTTKSNYNDV